MNSDFSMPPKDKMETRLTALLLGELTPEEAVEVSRMVRNDPELTALQAKLKKTIELVRESAASEAEKAAEATTPLKMSSGKREKLLERFKVIAPKELAPPSRQRVRWYVPASIAAALIGLLILAGLIIPQFARRNASTFKIAAAGEEANTEKLHWGLFEKKVTPPGKALSVLAFEPTPPRESARVPVAAPAQHAAQQNLGLDVAKTSVKGSHTTLYLPAGIENVEGENVAAVVETDRPIQVSGQSLGRNVSEVAKERGLATVNGWAEAPQPGGSPEPALRWRNSTSAGKQVAHGRGEDGGGGMGSMGGMGGSMGNSATFAGVNIAGIDPSSPEGKRLVEAFGEPMARYRPDSESRNRNESSPGRAGGSGRSEEALRKPGTSTVAKPSASTSAGALDYAVSDSVVSDPGAGLPPPRPSGSFGTDAARKSKMTPLPAEATAVALQDGMEGLAKDRSTELLQRTSEGRAQNANSDGNVEKAITEGVRRQELTKRMQLKLADAQAAQKRGEIEGAAKGYDEAIQLGKKVGAGIGQEMKQAVNGVVDTGTHPVRQAQRRMDFAEADLLIKRMLSVDPKNPQALNLKKENDEAWRVARPMLPNPEKREMASDIYKNKMNAASLVQDGRFLYENGRMVEATKKLQQATKLDPENRGAVYYQELISGRKYAQLGREREIMGKAMLNDVENQWAESPTLPDGPNSYARTNLVNTSSQRQAIYDKIRNVKIEVPSYSSVPLADVVKDVVDQAQKRDADAKGVNLLLGSNADSSGRAAAAPAVDAATGLPTPGGAGSADLSKVNVSIPSTLHNVTVEEALDIITKTADQPVKYSVEDWGVILSPSVNGVPGDKPAAKPTAKPATPVLGDIPTTGYAWSRTLDSEVAPEKKEAAAGKRVQLELPALAGETEQEGLHEVQAEFQVQRSDGAITSGLRQRLRESEVRQLGEQPKPTSSDNSVRKFKVDPNTFQMGLAGVQPMMFGMTMNQGGSRSNSGGGYGGGGSRAGMGGMGSTGNSATFAGVNIAGGGMMMGGMGGMAGRGGAGGTTGAPGGRNTTMNRGLENVTEVTNKEQIAARARDFLATAGVDLSSTNKAMFFDDRSGLLTVKASPADLDVVERAVQVLNMAPAKLQWAGKPESAKRDGSDKDAKPARAENQSARLVTELDGDAAAVRKPKPAAPLPVPQPEVQTTENPFSTFSLNVSDVSFKLAASSLEKNVMPDPSTVRSEEFVNAFDYHDNEPPPGVPVGFAWERARYPFAHNRDLVRFALRTAARGREPGRPLNIVLLLDNSGSMERADRVSIIREALRVLVAQLQAQDKISVVTFARTARLWADGLPGDQAAAVEGAGNLTPEGGTNLEEAMNLAYQTAIRHFLSNGVNRVVLLTDGAANLGDVDPDSLKKKVEAHRKQGIALDCYGIGWEGYNDDLLETLSHNGDGRYGFVNSPEEASTEFAAQLAGALQVAAADVKVQVEFNPRRVSAYRQIGYAKHQLTKQQFRDNTVDAAEIGAAETGNALYVVEVNAQGEGPLGVVRIRYKVPATGEFHEYEWPVPYNGSAANLEQASPAMRLAASASAFSEWLATSPFAAEVTTDRLLEYLRGVPEVFGADGRAKKLEWMIRQAKAIAGK